MKEDKIQRIWLFFSLGMEVVHVIDENTEDGGAFVERSVSVLCDHRQNVRIEGTFSIQTVFHSDDPRLWVDFEILRTRPLKREDGALCA